MAVMSVGGKVAGSVGGRVRRVAGEGVDDLDKAGGEHSLFTTRLSSETKTMYCYFQKKLE